jgi:hypothetical protein
MSENLVSCLPEEPAAPEHGGSICSETLPDTYEIMFCRNPENHTFCPALQATNARLPSVGQISECALFLVVTPYSLVEVYRCFRGTFRLHFQDRMITEASKSSYLYLAVFFIGLLICPEHGNGTLLRNICELLPNYTESHPRR